jgi:hypothetical protein
MRLAERGELGSNTLHVAVIAPTQRRGRPPQLSAVSENIVRREPPLIAKLAVILIVPEVSSRKPAPVGAYKPAELALANGLFTRPPANRIMPGRTLGWGHTRIVAYARPCEIVRPQCDLLHKLGAENLDSFA